MKSVRTSTIWRSLIYQGNDKIFESGKQELRNGAGIRNSFGHAFARCYPRSFASISKSLSSIPAPDSECSCAASRSRFGEAAETFTRAAALPRSVESVSSVVVCGSIVIRVHPWFSENLKKFSLNPVEGISTSDLNVQPSTAESATATTDYTDRTDAQTQKEQVRFMKITQNVKTIEQQDTQLTKRLCAFAQRQRSYTVAVALWAAS